MNKVSMRKRNFHGDCEIKCHECGKVVREATKTIRLDMPYCGGCGKRIDDAVQRYCGHCGEELDWNLQEDKA